MEMSQLSPARAISRVYEALAGLYVARRKSINATTRNLILFEDVLRHVCTPKDGRIIRRQVSLSGQVVPVSTFLPATDTILTAREREREREGERERVSQQRLSRPPTCTRWMERAMLLRRVFTDIAQGCRLPDEEMR